LNAEAFRREIMLLRVPPFCFGANLIFVLAMLAVETHSQELTFGPLVVPGTAVIFDPDNVLTPIQLAALRSVGSLNPTPAVKAMSFSPGPGQSFTFTASGRIGCCGVANVGPDGYPYSLENVTVIGSISGFSSPNGLPLVGVFTNGDPAGTAPSAYNYYSGSGLNDTEFSPILNQVFFIGDGLAFSGKQQVFDAPETATELWLGFVDGGTFHGPPANYGDNAGSLKVSGELRSDCSSLWIVNPEHFEVKVLQPLTSDVDVTDNKLRVNSGIRHSNQTHYGPYGYPTAISIYAWSGMVPKAANVALKDINLKYVNMLTAWQGTAWYGDTSGKTVPGWGAISGTTLPAHDIDFPMLMIPTFGLWKEDFYDSPQIGVPLHDRDGALRQVSYLKCFTTYVVCSSELDPRHVLHALGHVDWHVNYSGKLSYSSPPSGFPPLPPDFIPDPDAGTFEDSRGLRGLPPVMAPPAETNFSVDGGATTLSGCPVTPEY
jgi:hypothetical protein